jgi:hypothetical protein
MDDDFEEEDKSRRAEYNLSGKVSLPDIDDTSMAHVFNYVDYYQEDLFWSFLSDSFFILGGIAYLMLSLWDYCWPDSTTREQQGTIDYYYYYYALLTGLAPFVYVVNSIVDMAWASRVRSRAKVKRRMETLWAESRSITNSNASASVDINSAGYELPTWKRIARQFHKIRKHAARRRTIWAALTFGAAAFLAFVAVLLDYFGASETLSDLCDFLSVHMYFVSAVISVTGKRTSPWLASRYHHENLEDWGDLFFLIGSGVDGVLCDLNLDDGLTLWPTVASSLWLLDACFYLRSDFVMSEKIKSQLTSSNDDAHTLV